MAKTKKKSARKKKIARRVAVPATRKKLAKKRSAADRIYTCHDCLTKYRPGESHNCIPRTEADLFEERDEDLRDAFYTLRERASEFGEQRIYNNARTVMFARRVCYMFVRPKKKYIELIFFLNRQETDPSIFRSDRSSKTRFWHHFRLLHSDQVEAPLLDWLREAYEASG